MAILDLRLFKPIVFMAVGVISISYHSLGQTEQHSAPERQKPIVIDGLNDDWPSPYPFADRDAKIQYAITNDSAMLYLSIKSSDDVMKGKFSRAGFTLFIDTKNEQNKSLSFDFLVDSVKQASPISQPADSLNDTLQEGRDFFPKRKEPSPIAQRPPVSLHEVVVTGTEKYDGRYAAQHYPAGFAVAVAANDISELIWEIAIPLSILSKDNQALLGRKISIGIVEYPLSPNDFDEVMNAALASPFTRKPDAQDSKKVAEAKDADGGGTQKDGTTQRKGGRGGGVKAVMSDGSDIGGVTGETAGNTSSGMPANFKREDVEDINELIAPTETTGERWQRAMNKNETWKSVRLQNKK